MNWNDIITPLAVPLVGYVAYQLQVWVKAHSTPQQFSAVAGLAHVAVQAVDQLNSVSRMTDAQRYELASESVVAGAKRLGLKLKDSEVNAFIHAAVREVHAQQFRA